MYFLRFVYTIFYLAFYILRKQKIESKKASIILHNLENKFDGKFDVRTLKKIKFYYALKVPAIYDAFLSLHNRNSNKQECERLLHYFICSSIFDNFFDRKELTDEEIYAITFDSENFKPKNFNERISLQSHLFILNFVTDKTKYLSVLKKEYNAQVQSRRQFDVAITNSEIEEITKAKGGNAVLLCSFYLDTSQSEIENNCWVQLGVIIQFINDLFDMHRDLQSGLQTIPNRIKNIEDFKIYYFDLISNLKNEINNIDLPKINKLQFTISIMGICALGLIAIEHLKKLQTKTGTSLNLNTIPNKDLIIDMEKKSNLWQWVKTVYQLSK